MYSGNAFIPGDYFREYYCGSSSGTTTNVEWLINGTRLEDLNLNYYVRTYYRQYTRQGYLEFYYIMSYYNNTTIQCRATLNNGEIGDSNSPTLLVQGEREINRLR